MVQNATARINVQHGLMRASLSQCDYFPDNVRINEAMLSEAFSRTRSRRNHRHGDGSRGADDGVAMFLELLSQRQQEAPVRLDLIAQLFQKVIGKGGARACVGKTLRVLLS